MANRFVSPLLKTDMATFTPHQDAALKAVGDDLMKDAGTRDRAEQLMREHIRGVQDALGDSAGGSRPVERLRAS